MVKIMIDTNIIISFILRPQGQAAKGLYKALVFPYTPLICDYIVDEVRRKFKGKLSAYATNLPLFERSLPFFHIVPTPPSSLSDGEFVLRDVKDMPILRAAIGSGADMLLTGDKDFLEAGLTNPQIVSVKDFLLM